MEPANLLANLLRNSRKKVASAVAASAAFLLAVAILSDPGTAKSREDGRKVRDDDGDGDAWLFRGPLKRWSGEEGVSREKTWSTSQFVIFPPVVRLIWRKASSTPTCDTGREGCRSRTLPGMFLM